MSPLCPFIPPMGSLYPRCVPISPYGVLIPHCVSISLLWGPHCVPVVSPLSPGFRMSPVCPQCVPNVPPRPWGVPIMSPTSPQALRCPQRPPRLWDVPNVSPLSPGFGISPLCRHCPQALGCPHCPQALGCPHYVPIVPRLRDVPSLSPIYPQHPPQALRCPQRPPRFGGVPNVPPAVPTAPRSEPGDAEPGPQPHWQRRGAQPEDGADREPLRAAFGVGLHQTDLRRWGGDMGWGEWIP